jgi:hypothetical protein
MSMGGGGENFQATRPLTRAAIVPISNCDTDSMPATAPSSFIAVKLAQAITNGSGGRKSSLRRVCMCLPTSPNGQLCVTLLMHLSSHWTTGACCGRMILGSALPMLHLPQKESCWQGACNGSTQDKRGSIDKREAAHRDKGRQILRQGILEVFGKLQDGCIHHGGVRWSLHCCESNKKVLHIFRCQPVCILHNVALHRVQHRCSRPAHTQQ